MHKEMRVVLDICAASRAAGLVARSDIGRCHSDFDDLAERCVSCVRILAPEGVGQQWVKPTITSAGCSHYASLDHYGHLFVSVAAPKPQSEVH